MKNLFVSCLESRIEDPTTYYGSFQLGPFPKGQGITIANALRRTILSEIPTLGIINAKLQTISSQSNNSNQQDTNIPSLQYCYAAHEYSILEGLRESTLDFLLNLQKVVFSSEEFFENTQVILLNIQGPGIVKAGDLSLPPGLLVVDPNQYLGTVTSNVILQGKFFISFGKQESPFSKVFNPEPGVLTLQPTFFPIKKVNYKIEMDEIYPEKELLNLEIWTNGSLQPRTALESSISTLIRIFRKLENNFNIFDHLISGNLRSWETTDLIQKPQFNLSQKENLNFLSGNFGELSDKQDSSLRISNYLDTDNTEDVSLTAFSTTRIGETKEFNDTNRLNAMKSAFSLLPIKRRLARLDIGNLRLSWKLYSYFKTQNINSVQDILSNSRHLEEKLKNCNPTLLNEFQTMLKPFEFKK